jgi:flagellar biosynthesis GTPase FlhF
MVRFFVALILTRFAIAESQAQVATPSPSTSPTPQASVSSSTSAGRFDQLRKQFDQLSAEQQERILQNMHRWQELSQDEREVLRQRERVQRQKLEASINEAYQKSGLQLNDEQRALFHKRYLQERRHLEEQLAHEIEEKRQVGNAAIIEMLKKEFSNLNAKTTPPVAAH